MTKRETNLPRLHAWLQLMQLADSALPIGALSHSFGLESLTSEGALDVPRLASFFETWLAGNGHMEAVLCIRGHAVASALEWQELNAAASAMRPARETRDASLTLGKRFLALALSLQPNERLRFPGPSHLSPAFGLVAAALGASPEEAAGAYLHQALFGAVSACQRLLPLGQSSAMQLLWRLKELTVATIEEAAQHPELEAIRSVQPMVDILSMRHPFLHTRLFIS